MVTVRRTRTGNEIDCTVLGRSCPRRHSSLTLPARVHSLGDDAVDVSIVKVRARPRACAGSERVRERERERYREGGRRREGSWVTWVIDRHVQAGVQTGELLPLLALLVLQIADVAQAHQ